MAAINLSKSWGPLIAIYMFFSYLATREQKWKVFMIFSEGGESEDGLGGYQEGTGHQEGT